MRFSIGLPHIADAPAFNRVETLVELAQAMERAGIDACSVTDHPFPVIDETQTGHHAFDPFALLACIAGQTSVLGLHHMLVVLPYRNPFLVANAAATVDNASGGGRVVVGVGAGYLEPEFAALGVDFADRDALMEEGIDALEAAWTGEPVHAGSPRWTAVGNTMPAPLTSPRPPLWMGGNSRAAIDRAVRRCDGWAPFGVGGERAANTRTADVGTFANLRKRIALARELCERHERTAPLEICLVRPPVRWGEDPSHPSAAEEVAELAEMGVSWVSFRFASSSRAEFLEKIEAWSATATALGG
jgi:probable F420-dependent oxidoreductase